MGKLNCNIVTDLLPSYLDGICTKDTKDAVDSHLAECSQCLSRAQMMRNTEFVSDKAEYREIDYMKKIKNSLDAKQTVGCLLLAAITLFVTAWLALGGYGYRRAWVYGILPFALLAVTGMLLADENKKMGKTQKITAAVSLILTGYGILFTVFVSVYWGAGTASESRMSFLEPQHVGPFCYYQFLTIILLQAALYLYGLYGASRKNHASLLQMGICITGEYIMLAQINWMHALDSAEAFSHVFPSVAMPFLGGAAGTLLAMSIGKERRQSE